MSLIAYMASASPAVSPVGHFADPVIQSKIVHTKKQVTIPGVPPVVGGHKGNHVDPSFHTVFMQSIVAKNVKEMTAVYFTAPVHITYINFVVCCIVGLQELSHGEGI